MIIESRQNPKIKNIKKLNNKKYRDLLDSYLVYGDNIIKEVYSNGIVSCVVTTDLEYSGNNVLYVTSNVMECLVNIRPVPKILFVMKKEKRNFIKGNTLVLDGVSDPGNLGTILRTSLAFGIKNIFLSSDSVDIYNQKVIQAMQGAHFHLNIKYGDINKYLNESDNLTITTFLDEDSNYNGVDGYFNLVVGNEGNGISEDIKTIDHVNYKINIEYESLNVAVATGIIINNIIKG